MNTTTHHSTSPMGATLCAAAAPTVESRHAGAPACDYAADASEHPAEDELMDGTEQVPVGQPDAAGGIEHRGLANLDAAILVRIDLELQPQPAGDPHLRRQAQPTPRLERLDPPEVDRVADAEID